MPILRFFYLASLFLATSVFATQEGKLGEYRLYCPGGQVERTKDGNWKIVLSDLKYGRLDEKILPTIPSDEWIPELSISVTDHYLETVIPGAIPTCKWPSPPVPVGSGPLLQCSFEVPFYDATTFPVKFKVVHKTTLAERYITENRDINHLSVKRITSATSDNYEISLYFWANHSGWAQVQSPVQDCSYY